MLTSRFQVSLRYTYKPRMPHAARCESLCSLPWTLLRTSATCRTANPPRAALVDGRLGAVLRPTLPRTRKGRREYPEVESGIDPAAPQSGRAVAVVHRAFLRIGKHRVGFASCSKALFRFGLLLHIAVGVILQSSFAIRRLNLFGRSFARHTQNFVEIF